MRTALIKRVLPVMRIVCRRNRLGLLGMFIIIGIALVAVLAPQIAPYSPTQFQATERLKPPSLEHLFGTDVNGRDIFSRVVYGSRISLEASMVVVTIALIIGMVIGGSAGYLGGWIDEVLMRVTDIFLAFPGLVLAMAVNAALGPGIRSAMLAVSFIWWPSYARMIRGQIISVKYNEYVEAARALGLSNFRILVKHILPNCIAPIIVQVTLDAGAVLLTIAGLSFIGLGAQPPTPEWGTMVNEGREYLLTQWWWSTFPGLAITIVVISFNMVGDLLRDITDPRLRRGA